MSAALLDDDLAGLGGCHIALHCSAAGSVPAGSRQHTAWSARAQTPERVSCGCSFREEVTDE